MIAVIQGSNRRGNATRAVADAVTDYFAASGEVSVLVDLEQLPGSMLHADMYEAGRAHTYLDAAAETLTQADRWVFIFPEYNGSFPGALKLFIDALSVRDYKALFGGKVTALIGTASGRAGNLRGLDHLTGVLHHLGSTVMPQAMPISLIDGLLDENRSFTDAKALKGLEAYLSRFLSYAAPLVATEV